MTKKLILLFALLCGAASAETVTTYLDKIPPPTNIQAVNPKPYFDGLIGATAIPPDNEIPQYTFTSPVYAKHISIAGHLIITKQEAQDVVRAMEILMPGVPDVYEKNEGTSGYGATMTSPSYMKGMNATREQIDKGLKDLAWARSILEAWKKKIGEAK